METVFCLKMELLTANNVILDGLGMRAMFVQPFRVILLCFHVKRVAVSVLSIKTKKRCARAATKAI